MKRSQEELNADFLYSLECARNVSSDFGNALANVLDTAWGVETYLLSKSMPCDGTTIAHLTAEVMTQYARNRAETLRQERELLEELG